MKITKMMERSRTRNNIGEAEDGTRIKMTRKHTTHEMSRYG